MNNKSVSAVIFFAFSVLSSSAFSWETQPRIRGELAYNDNGHLSLNNPTTTVGQLLSPAVKLSNNSEVSEFSLDSRFDFWKYNEDTISHQDQFFDLKSSRRLEKSSYRLDASYYRTSTTVTELYDSGLGLRVADRVLQLAVAPSAQFQFSELDSASVSYRVSKVEYQSENAGLVDYLVHSVSLAYQHNLSVTDQVSLTGQFQRYDYESVGSVENFSDTLSVYVGYLTQFNETLSGSLYLGVQKSEYELKVAGIGEPFDEEGGYVAANLTSRNELNRYTIDFSRSVSPSSSGSSFNQDKLKVAARRRFVETISGVLALTTIRREAIDSRFASDDRNYFELSTGLLWRLTRDLSLDTRYRYRRQRYPTLSSDWADSNAIIISVVYKGSNMNW